MAALAAQEWLDGSGWGRWRERKEALAGAALKGLALLGGSGLRRDDSGLGLRRKALRQALLLRLRWDQLLRWSWKPLLAH